MILFQGKILDDKEQTHILDILEDECKKTLARPGRLTADMVINACDVLYKRVISGEFDDVVRPLISALSISHERFMEMAELFSRENLEYKCRIELGEDFDAPIFLKNGTKRLRYPLGILFHIAAGNVDGLPAYSVVEGLLCGNINILKLPTGDSGLSIRLLSELISVEPAISEYVYVFDVPSTEFATLRKFGEIADGIVVWGSDAAVEAANSMAGTNTKVIPWGHKLSFAYATLSATDEQLKGLAKHICTTNQVLCSSCQGIFLDTDSEKELEKFGEKFFEFLKEANLRLGKADMGMRGKNTIRIYNELLNDSCKKIFNEEGVSVIIAPDKNLELSYMFRNVWVKRLPREEIVGQLKSYKNHLQTAGLLCAPEEKDELAGLLARAGVVRITGANMSRMISGEAHDGTYPLKEYSRVVEID